MALIGNHRHFSRPRPNPSFRIPSGTGFTRSQRATWRLDPDQSTLINAEITFKILSARRFQNDSIGFTLLRREHSYWSGTEFPSPAGSPVEAVSEESTDVMMHFKPDVPYTEYKSGGHAESAPKPLVGVTDAFGTDIFMNSVVDWVSYEGEVRVRLSNSEYGRQALQGIGFIGQHRSYSQRGSAMSGGGLTTYLTDVKLVEFNGRPFNSSLVSVQPLDRGRPPGWLAPLALTRDWAQADVFTLSGRRIATPRQMAQVSSLRPAKGLYLIRVRSPAGMSMLKAVAP